MEPLVDRFGRVHRDLRISVTDRCNFRCAYCMPAEGMTWLPRDEVLRYEELERVARLLVERFGIASIRITGGEPTVRSHLPVLIERLAPLRVPQVDGSTLPLDLSLTTNGATLALVADDLAAAGLRRVNISLDSLRPERFHAVTRRDELFRVLEGVDAAIAAGLTPVKVNCVVMRGVNDDELLEFAEYGRRTGTIVRFIEFMPLDAGHTWQNDQVVTQAEILAVLRTEFELEPVGEGAEPAERFRYADGLGEIGVIPSVSRPFCDSCDRLRLTADGQLRNCLFALDEFDLRGPLRAGAGDDELADVIRAAVSAKWAGHQINQVHFISPRRSMSQIGG